MIGDIIKTERLAQNLTRKELAKGICSEKYIYLIENNERNPSAYILNDLSDRLGVDLFEFYPYINYDKKDKIYKHRQNFERYNQNSNLEKLKAEADQAAQLKAFQEEPLIYDIKMINGSYQNLVLGKPKKTINELTRILKKDDLIIDPITLINFYVVLSTSYQLESDWDNAEKAIKTAYKMIKNKDKFTRYNTTMISVLISMTSLLYHMENYEKLITYSKFLMSFQEKYNEYNRIYYVDLYLAFAYFYTDEHEKAREHFMQAGYAALLFKNPLDLQVITQMKDFKVLSKELAIDPGFIDQLFAITPKEEN